MEMSAEQPGKWENRAVTPEEECVLCRKKLGYPKDLPVEHRPNYIEGAGDVCDQCADLLWQ